MIIKKQLEKLTTEKSTPCISISLNTHRTFPENAQDKILLKNLLKEAEQRVIAEFGERSSISLLDKITTVSTEVDTNYNLDSLHIFLSNDTKEIIKTAWPVNENTVHISETFSISPIIKEYVRNEEYLILLLSQGGVHLYNAFNNNITNEVNNDDFPFSEMTHSIIDPEDITDSKHLDNIVREYLNKVDKAVVKVNNLTDLQCLVICTEDNYSRLMQVADKPGIYYGYAHVDYNNNSKNDIAKQSWEVIKELQQKGRAEAINEMLEAVGQGKVLTDLQEIYLAAVDGKGELLIVSDDFTQSVLMTGERSFDLVSDNTISKVIDDITSNIAWEVLSKKGRVIFTSQTKIKELGDIVLKTRY